ncbi:MAG TPA: type IV toxin-antitoxin system AbiEi family antitoxin domain-containing protein [Streptosporangiaceae bacterium]|jgi:hypothetical protein
MAVQNGVLGSRQALESGLPSDSIETLLRTGRWQRLNRGVYATFTGSPSREALLWAVLVRAGPDAALSHETAAELFGFARHFGDRAAPIHVTVPRDRRSHQIPGAILHRVGNVAVWRHPYLLPPRTRVEPTILDLVGSSETAEEAFGWMCRAMGKGLTNTDRLYDAIQLRRNLRWRAVILESLGDVERGVRSNLELRYVRGVERAHGLPEAGRQVRVLRLGRPCYLDNFYAEWLVGVELDGLVAHPPGERWRDFRRDNAGAADGITTLRYGWADVTGRPCQVAGQVATVLQRHGWAGRARSCGVSCVAREQVNRA